MNDKTQICLTWTFTSLHLLPLKSSMVSVMAFYSGVPSSKLKEGYIVNCSIDSNYFANKKSIQNYG